MRAKSKSDPRIGGNNTRFRKWSNGVVLATSATVLGCQSSSRPAAVRGTIEVTAEAVSKGDVRRLSRLIVRDDDRPCSEEELKELLRRTGPELGMLLRKAAAATERVQATHAFELVDGSVVTVREQQGRVSIYSVPHAEACPSSVVAALRQLSVHLKSVIQRVDGTYSGPVYLSQNAREQWILDVKTWTDGLVAPLELDVEEVGDMAIAKLPTGRVVELSFEQGCWRIEKFR